MIFLSVKIMFLISVVYFFWNLIRFNPLNLLSESYNTWYKFIIFQKPGGIVALLDEAWYAKIFPFIYWYTMYVVVYLEKEIAD